MEKKNIKSSNEVLKPLLSMAEGDYDKAVAEWTTLREASQNENAMVTQNLAVCSVYIGEMQEVCLYSYYLVYSIPDIVSSSTIYSLHILPFRTLTDVPTDRLILFSNLLLALTTLSTL